MSSIMACIALFSRQVRPRTNLVGSRPGRAGEVWTHGY